MMPIRRFLLALLFATLSGPGAASAAADDVDLVIEAGRLSLQADAASVAAVLAQVAHAAGAQLTVRGQLPDQPRRWSLHGVPVAEAVLQIARPWNILVVPGGTHGVREIFVIGVIGAGGAAGAAVAPAVPAMTDRLPVPDADTLARRDAVAALAGEPGETAIRALEAALGDPDAGVRLEALQALGRIDSDAAVRVVGQVALGGRSATERAAAVAVLETSRRDLAHVMLAAVRGRSDAALGAR